MLYIEGKNVLILEYKVFYNWPEIICILLVKHIFILTDVLILILQDMIN